MDPLVSVIVPIYNVEPYVRKCLDSLKNQTLKQIEVICIDDGSTDKSGEIAEEYKSENWPQFRIIHTDNKGLSAARNKGIDEARVDYLMFVDSDDWVEPDFCELAHRAAVEHQADMVTFGFLFEQNGKQRRINSAKQPAGIVDEFTAHEYGSWAVWNKLYRKKLFDGLRFPEGRNSEDVAMTHKLVHRANQIMVMHNVLYHYEFRSDGISNTHTLSNRRDFLAASIERYNDFVSYGYPEDKCRCLYDSMCGAAIGFLASCNAASHNDPMIIEATSILNKIEGLPSGLSWKQKAALLAWRIDERLLFFLGKVTGRNNL